MSGILKNTNGKSGMRKGNKVTQVGGSVKIPKA